jgi:hypothetical protein
MIVHNFHFIGAAFLPDEADAELIINPDTVLSFPIPFEDFQSVSRRASQVIQVFGGVQQP